MAVNVKGMKIVFAVCLFIGVSLMPYAESLCSDVYLQFKYFEGIRHDEMEVFSSSFSPSTAACCQMCADDEACWSVSYNKTSSVCGKSALLHSIETYQTGFSGMVADAEFTTFDVMKSVVKGGRYTFGRSCYFLIEYQQNWDLQQEECKYQAAHLADITTADEIAFVKNMLSGMGVTEEVFIGGRVIVNGTFEWTDGTPVPLTGAQQNWSNGKPSSRNSGYCMYIQKQNDQWANEVCESEKFALCEED